MTSLPQPSRANSAPTASATLDQPPIRRNLFPTSNTQNRRPAPASANPFDIETEDVSRNGILARDQSGRVVLDGLLDMVPPEIEGEEGEETEKTESTDKRLIELYRTQNRQSIDEAELKAAVQKSLREKVASLDDDKWMYEIDDEMENSGLQ